MSNREYYHISQVELEDALGLHGELRSGLAFLPVKIKGTAELVYDAIVDDAFTVRCYSSVVPGNGSRDVGEDAIRVVRMFVQPDGRMRPVGKEKRVNRIKTWRKNLLARIESVATEEIICCMICGQPMVIRTGKYGKFWGCVGYSFRSCKGVRRIE